METSGLNSRMALQKLAAQGRLSLLWPVLLVFARLVFALVAQGLVAVVFFSTAASPLQAAAKWWPVYGTLIDLGCFGLIVWRARKEGLGFRDLAGYEPRRLGKDILLGLGYVLVFFPVAMIGMMGFSLLLYGNPQPPPVYSPLPAWGAVYAVLVFPAVWGLMEQVTYQGYALPRLDALLKSPGLAIAIVVFGWAIQHIALPLEPDGRFMLYRFLSFIPLGIVLTLIYLRRRRLIPFIIAHWAVDLLGIVSGLVVPMLMK